MRWDNAVAFQVTYIHISCVCSYIYTNFRTVSRSMDKISWILANLTNFSLSTINLDNLCNFKCQERQFQPIFEVSFSKMSKSHSCQFQKVDNYARVKIFAIISHTNSYVIICYLTEIFMNYQQNLNSRRS